jgi:uncharacterized spore protein YtfJ
MVTHAARRVTAPGRGFRQPSCQAHHAGGKSFDNSNIWTVVKRALRAHDGAEYRSAQRCYTAEERTIRLATSANMEVDGIVRVRSLRLVWPTSSTSLVARTYRRISPRRRSDETSSVRAAPVAPVSQPTLDRTRSPNRGARALASKQEEEMMDTNMTTEELVRQITSIPDQVGASACFGTPVERHGHAVIPVARVTFGYGLGYGRGSGGKDLPSENGHIGQDGGEGEGGGGGGGGGSSPVAVITSRRAASDQPIVDLHACRSPALRSPRGRYSDPRTGAPSPASAVNPLRRTQASIRVATRAVIRCLMVILSEAKELLRSMPSLHQPATPRRGATRRKHHAGSASASGGAAVSRASPCCSSHLFASGAHAVHATECFPMAIPPPSQRSANEHFPAYCSYDFNSLSVCRISARDLRASPCRTHERSCHPGRQ